MARTIRDAKMETRAARDRLSPGTKPHYKTLIPGKLHLGYRRKRKDLPGTWLVRRYIGNERYRVAPLGFADDFQDADSSADVLNFAEAQKLAHAHLTEMEGRQRCGSMTVADAISDYVAWMKVHRTTGEEVERRAAKLILPELGKIKIAELTTTRLDRWRNALAESPALLRTRQGAPQNYRPTPPTEDARRARRATANKLVTILKAALNMAFRNDLVADDKAWRRFKAFERVDASRPRFLTVTEAQRLINAADRNSGFRDVVHAALLTGCRYGELCALRVRDFAHGKIAIRKSKSGTPRDVRLTDEGVEFFQQLTAGRVSNEFLLRNHGRIERAGKPTDNITVDDGWRKSEQARPMRAACAQAGIDPPIGIHQLRHTYASLAIMGDEKNGRPSVP